MSGWVLGDDIRLYKCFIAHKHIFVQRSLQMVNIVL
jgi:hypothetical protein